MTKNALILVLSTAALAACGQRVAAPEPTAKAKVASAILDQGSPVPDALLRDAMEERVGLPDMGEAAVVQSWTWHPRGAASYVVWVTCRGEGEWRTCAVAAAPSVNGFVSVKAHTVIGREPARSISADGESLSISGDDDRGAWTQSLNVIGQDAIAIGERSYTANASR